MAEAKAFKMIPHCTKRTITYEINELVRCKDCKKHDTYDCHITYLTTQKTPNDWYCADGERREYVKPPTESATDWNGVECE